MNFITTSNGRRPRRQTRLNRKLCRKRSFRSSSPPTIPFPALLRESLAPRDTFPCGLRRSRSAAMLEQPALPGSPCWTG